MRKNRLSLLEKKEDTKKKYEGHGKYIFQNRTNGDFHLPKPGLKGEKSVPPGKNFEGDSYFLSFVPSFLVIVEVLESKESVMQKEVLLMEQPPVYTASGQVEFVKDEEPLIQEDIQESKSSVKKGKKKLLLDSPNSNVEVIK